MHSKVFVKLKKTQKPSRPGKKTQKNPKKPQKPKKTQKNPKKPTGLGFFKKTRVFPTLPPPRRKTRPSKNYNFLLSKKQGCSNA
jgi:hypothetical protein